MSDEKDRPGKLSPGIVEAAIKALTEAGEKAKKEKESGRIYARLTDEEKEEVLNDMKEYQRITEKYRRYEKLVNALMESVPKNPTIH